MKKLLSILTLVLSVLCVPTVSFAEPRNSMLAANETEISSVPLPYDAEVEYLKGDGSSAIMTDIYWRLCDYYTEVDFTMPEVRETANKIILGSSSTTINYVMSRYRTNRDLFGVNSTMSLNLPLLQGTRYIGSAWFEDGLYQFSLGGAIATYSSTSYGGSQPLGVFTTAGYSGGCFTGYIHAVRIYSDKTKTVLLADIVPVRIGEEGFMYDRIGGGLYGNIGTGSFLIGPDKEN